MNKTGIIFLMFFFTFLTSSLFSQEKTSWKEMEDFHGVMSSTFHPAEEDNLQPVKSNAGNLLKKAKAWQKSSVPQGFNAAATKPILKNLVKQCTVIKEAVAQKKSDAELKVLITEAHEVFHEIKEKCLIPEKK